MSDRIVWAAPCGSWGGCDFHDLIWVRESDLTTDELETIKDPDTDDPYTVIALASDRIKYGGTGE